MKNYEKYGLKRDREIRFSRQQPKQKTLLLGGTQPN